MTDPFDVLRSHVRSVALLERPTVEPDELIERITTHEASVIPLRSPRRRRWGAAIAVTSIVVVGGAGVAAFRGESPGVQVRDVLCRSTSKLDSSAMAVESTDDPIGACTQLWRSGQLRVDDATPTPGGVPRLVACTGEGRPVEVYPVTNSIGCVDLGLADADTSANSADPVVLLQDRLAEIYASAGCLRGIELGRIVQNELSSLGLEAWKVEVDTQATCALAGVDLGSTTVRIVADPLTPQIKEEP